MHSRFTELLHVTAVLPLDVDPAPDDVEVDELEPDEDDVEEVEEEDEVGEGSDDSFPPHAIATTDEVATAASNRRRSATAEIPIP